MMDAVRIFSKSSFVVCCCCYSSKKLIWQARLEELQLPVHYMRSVEKVSQCLNERIPIFFRW